MALKPANRGLTGRVALLGAGQVSYASSLERDLIMALDFDWRVRRIQEQPYTLTYLAEGKRRRYTPDVLAKYDDNQEQWTVVYEVKEKHEVVDSGRHFAGRWRAAKRDCGTKGWTFRIVTEAHLRTPYVENVRFLRAYRELPRNVMHREALLYSLKALGETTPRTLLAATWADDERRLEAIPSLWQLITERRIETTLVDRLTMHSPIWTP